MQEDEQNTNRTDIFHQEQIEVEESTVTKCSPVREFITDHLMRHKPTDKDTRQEAYDGKEQLSCGEIEEIEDRLAEEQRVVPRS